MHVYICSFMYNHAYIYSRAIYAYIKLFETFIDIETSFYDSHKFFRVNIVTL